MYINRKYFCNSIIIVVTYMQIDVTGCRKQFYICLNDFSLRLFFEYHAYISFTEILRVDFTNYEVFK